MIDLILKAIDNAYSKRLELLDLENKLYRKATADRNLTLDYFNASWAGHCIKKHLYRKSGFEEEKISDKSLRRMRQGTLIHEDIQASINNIIRLDKELEKFNFSSEYFILKELHIEIPEHKVSGRADIVAMNDKDIYIFDIKTLPPYAWKKLFGRKENREKTPSNKYALQLGTYAIGMQKRFGDKYSIKGLVNIYVNIETGIVKNIKLDPAEWIEKAGDYWDEVNISIDQLKLIEMQKGITLGVPYEIWECKYCPFAKLCYKEEEDADKS